MAAACRCRPAVGIKTSESSRVWWCVVVGIKASELYFNVLNQQLRIFQQWR
ncbi:hypothetical protein M8C21_017640 [Ambrosia artemisiifolia]|uniref:Uncharacterized protein n=1 Tax=Ambrosia artemisiifolia TaxID=4212 RepID=A0AAD5CGR8_AMBAR|nr:hypothetical protein M8C21_017640 [Ambrosia artemisiifolia]